MEQKQLLTIKEASLWASDYLKRDVSESNISYLIQYGKIIKHNGGSSVFVNVIDLQQYYESFQGQREIDWKKRYYSSCTQRTATYNFSKVLLNCRKLLSDDFEVFLVANDKYNLYPKIADNSGMQIINQFKRPVLNRTERDKSPYSEIIFHLKDK